MPWTMSDYPPSWKNLAQLERKSDRHWKCNAQGWL